MTTFTDESAKLFSGRFLLPHEIAPWIAAQQFGAMPANHTVLHHTWSPTYDQWSGRSTLDGIFAYYRRDRGWPAGVGPHFWVAPRERGGPLGVWIGTHPRHDGIHVAGFNHRSLGIETAWNGDAAPFTPAVEAVLRTLVFALSSRLGIPLRWTHAKAPGLSLHRWWASKSCPGTKNTDVRMAAAMLPQKPPMPPPLPPPVPDPPQEDPMADPEVLAMLKSINANMEAMAADLRLMKDRVHLGVREGGFQRCMANAYAAANTARLAELADDARRANVPTGFEQV